jgi:hypothetical protein
VFVKANKKLLTIMKTLTYYIMELIIEVKSFMIRAPGQLNCFSDKLKYSLNIQKITY